MLFIWVMAGLLHSVKYALSGVRAFFTTERNGRIQGIIALLVIVIGVVFHISKTEWIWVILCIIAVLGLEMANSAIEKLCDLVSAEYNPAIKLVKDISAGAVLLAAVGAAIIGSLIFWPYIQAFFRL
jgi:diacylglycerol kinase